jgi:polyisoprenoid-binding protein YceI
MKTFNRFFKKYILSAAILFLWGAVGHAATYTIDPSHSRMGFAVKHLMGTEVQGQFNEYEGTVEYDPADPGATKVDVTIQAASIDTNEAKRDEHLRGADFLKTEEFPTITFKAAGVNKTDSNYVIVGDLTIKGVTKTISIPSQLAGPIQSPFGGEVMAITGETVVNRQDFGVSWNKILDNGGLLVGDEARLIINVEAKKE